MNETRRLGMTIRTKIEYNMALKELNNLQKAITSIASQLHSLEVWKRELEHQITAYEIRPEPDWHEGVVLIHDPVTDEMRLADKRD